MVARPDAGIVEEWCNARGGLAIALGGGGALGAAHVGVLEVLDEYGVFPWIVAGTSAGAIIGGAYAAGLNPHTIGKLVRQATWSNFGVVTPRPRLGVLDTAGLLSTIKQLGGDRLIEDLPVRFGAVATDVKTRKAVLMDSGSISTALCASMAVPGLFAPVKRDGRWYIDGGAAANLPLQAAFDMGATHVIGVRATPEWDNLHTRRTESEVTKLERLPNVTMIRPKLEGYAMWSRRDVNELILRGREAAEAVIAST
jgi:NTE family protein